MDHLRLTFFLLLLAVLSSLSDQQRQITDQSEVRALDALAWRWNLPFPRDSDPCAWPNRDSSQSWFKCYCDHDRKLCHITSLLLARRNLVGEIPRELFELTELVHLNLFRNMLEGPLPDELGHLTKLRHLDLGVNTLTGHFPAIIGNLTQLQFLNLFRNMLEGPLPDELGHLTKLRHLDLGVNTLTGHFPAIIGNLTQLQFLNLAVNNFSGPIHSTIGHLHQLKCLFIHSCGLSEELPRELANLKKLEILWAPDNLFKGKLPEFLGNLTNLRELKIQGTLLEGPVPASFAKLTNLEILILDDLSLMGSTLAFIKNLTHLTLLSLRNSHISGNLPYQLGNIYGLRHLDLSFNELSGSIPGSFKNFMSLEFLSLGSNNLEGDAPFGMVTPILAALDMSFNNISGNFPHYQSGLAMNLIGTPMNENNVDDRKQLGLLECIRRQSCTSKALNYYSSLAINCGGEEYKSSFGIDYLKDSEILKTAAFYMDSEFQWLVSTTEVEESRSVETTDSKIMGTFDPEIYKTARVSTKSLRYFVLGLANGTYIVKLHFAEIVMDDYWSLAGIGRRIFDVYIQGQQVLKNFNILNETKKPYVALIKTFQANVTTAFMDIHFLWVGRGTCCIPRERTYGPLVSAISISKVETEFPEKPSWTAPDDETKRRGRVAGVVFLCIAILFILSSVLYLWWIRGTIYHRVHSESSKW